MHRQVAPATVSPSVKLGGGTESSLTRDEIQPSVPLRTIEVDGAVYMSTSHVRQASSFLSTKRGQLKGGLQEGADEKRARRGF